jgi:hypothetical protein
MKTKIKQWMTVSVLAIGVSYGTIGLADGARLPPIDSYLTTMVEKSVVAGSIRKDVVTGMIVMDNDMNVMFDYTGKVYSVRTNEHTGVITSLGDAIGTIQGTAKFPLAFAQAAIAAKAALMGLGPMPMMPAVIPWTCATCTLVVAGTTYRSVVDRPDLIPGASQMDAASLAGTVDAMKMQGRAFTGLTPVEVGSLIASNSLSVRMAGCSALVAASGPNAGKVGTLCLNGTFSFDLSGVLLPTSPTDMMTPMTSTITGTGTSNCTTVLHKPLQMQ